MKRLLILLLLLTTTVHAQEQLVSSVETEEQKEPCLQTITGQVRDQMTNELIPNTVVSLRDKNGNPIQTLMATEKATFTFKVECGSTYKITASKESYNPQSKVFTTSDDSGIKLQTKILLDQGRIDFIYDPAKETKTADISETATQFKVESSELVKPIKANLLALEDKKEIKTEEKPKVEENVKKEPKKVAQVKREVQAKKDNDDVLVLKPVIFDYESSYLNLQAKKDLLNVVSIMKKHPDLVIECASYTDAKGSEKYNLWMSERRAKRTVDYIIRRGIHPSRISGKGYGKAKLINDCTDDCTDEQRAVNRRTEFKIVKK